MTPENALMNEAIQAASSLADTGLPSPGGPRPHPKPGQTRRDGAATVRRLENSTTDLSSRVGLAPTVRAGCGVHPCVYFLRGGTHGPVRVAC